MNRMKTRYVLIGFGIVAFGVLGLVVMVALRPEPPRVERPVERPLVTTVRPHVREGHLTVQGNGTVRPVREINLIAEVSGRVVEVSEALVSGGFFRSGQVLLQIDSTDYVNAVAIAEAEVTQRRFELLTAQEEVAVSREEWARLQRRTGEERLPDSSAMGRLVLKEPQLLAAQARLKSAQARLGDARTRLARTRLIAPFNGRVRDKAVDVGQFTGPGYPVATLYSTDAVEIVVPLLSREAALIEGLWDRDLRRARQIPATVFADYGGRRYQWEGYVDRTEGTLDVATRTINVVVRVPQPYRLEGERPPLMVGTFTTVALQGRLLDRYVVLPREALREGDTVWLVEDGALHIRAVEVIQEVEAQVYLHADLEADDPVITSSLPVMNEGMPVRIATSVVGTSTE